MGEPIEMSHRFPPVDREAWADRVRRDLKGKGPEKLRARLLDGVEVAVLHTAEDAPDTARGRPGAPPFVRGAEPARRWAIAHEVRGDELGELRRSAERARDDGADALHLGPAACARVRDASDLGELLSGLERPVSLEPGAGALAWAAALDRMDPRPAGGVVFDPLACLARDGALDTSVARAGAQLAELVAHHVERAPAHRPVWVDARPAHEAGAAAVDELGIALAAAVDHLRVLSDAGAPLADLPRRMAFAFALDSDLFLGLAKLRAARLAWSKVLRTLGIDGAEQGMRIHAFSSKRALEALDPHTNLLRGTASAFAAVLGGAERVSVAPWDGVFGTPSGHAQHLARATQHLLRGEAHLGHVLDPAGGSHYVERLTEDLARGAWKVFQEVSHLGGVARGLLDGSLLERVTRSAEARAEAVAARRRGRVGVNRYPAPEDPRPRAEAPAGVPEPGGAQDLAAVRAEAAAQTRGALFAALREAVAEAPFAAIRAVLADGDEPASAEPLLRFREGAAFEALRRRAAALDEADRRAVVMGVGAATALKPRMDFAREALEVAGLRAAVLDAREAPEAALEALDARGAPATVAICASDDDVPEVVPRLVGALRERDVRVVVVAGRPSEGLDGVDRFVHLGMDAVEVLGGVVAILAGEVGSDSGADSEDGDDEGEVTT
ncbi:MAG TPA: methylmalonyl-CoA mutase family protein [Sandaracinaceae bacterium LLY-WYZ-13_1]|nr:methylmalonyl-CoA mutase family protein [Sandaracinaceae bacterium LLY-WYZ-13_1]